jgi:hypothetical protein
MNRIREAVKGRATVERFAQDEGRNPLLAQRMKEADVMFGLPAPNDLLGGSRNYQASRLPV